MRPPTLAALLGLLACSLGAAPLGAQLQGSSSMSVLATANLSSTIKVRGTQDLNFGTVIPGVAKTVSHTSQPAGTTYAILQFDGDKNAEVQIDFNLPNQLVTPTGRRLTIDSWTGCHSIQSTIPGCTAFVPGTPQTRLRSNNGKLWLWFGGTVRPTVTQGTGTYTATVQVTMLYTGN